MAHRDDDSSEKSVQEPAKIAGRGIDGVAAAEEPEPAAVLVLDLPVVARWRSARDRSSTIRRRCVQARRRAGSGAACAARRTAPADGPAASPGPRPAAAASAAGPAAAMPAASRPGGRAQRPDAADAALRHVALDRRGAVDHAGHPAVDQPIDQDRHVRPASVAPTRSALAAARRSAARPAARRDAWPRHQDRDRPARAARPATWRDGRGWRLGRAVPMQIACSVRSTRSNIRSSRRAPCAAPFQLGADDARSGGRSRQTRLPASAKARETPAGCDNVRRGDRLDRLDDTTEGLVEAADDFAAKAQGERRPRRCQKLFDAFETKPAQGRAIVSSARRRAAIGRGRGARCRLAGRHHGDGRLRVSCDRPRGTRRVGDRGAGRRCRHVPRRSTISASSAASPPNRCAAPGGVDPDPVWPIRRGQRRIAQAPGGQHLERPGIALRRPPARPSGRERWPAPVRAACPGHRPSDRAARSAAATTLPAAVVHGGDQWLIRRRHGGARLAPQQVGRPGRQENRDDPSHHLPPRSRMPVRRRGSAPARAASVAAPGRASRGMRQRRRRRQRGDAPARRPRRSARRAARRRIGGCAGARNTSRRIAPPPVAGDATPSASIARIARRPRRPARHGAALPPCVSSTVAALPASA